MRSLIILVSGVIACGGSDATVIDADDTLADASPGTPDAARVPVLGMVTNVRDVACPGGAPGGSTCRQVTVTGCPLIESEPIDATLAILAPATAATGTITHFSGGGGQGFQIGGSMSYRGAGFRQVFVAWASDWEQTQSEGIKAAGCRPSTILKWIFDEPTLHAGSRSAGFCGEGFSGGSGQLGYALAHYGLADYLDYVNELSGPPFARIDLGCDGDAPATAQVCGATVTMRLPAARLDAWENIAAPLTCGATGVPLAELARWNADSIAVGGVYDHPATRVEFFDCTFQATAVTGMAQLYHDEIARAIGGDPTRVQFHCYTQADGCQGEGLGRGNMEATAAMLAGCTPRH